MIRLFGFFLLTLTASGWAVPDLNLPAHQGAVNDFANILSPNTRDYLERLSIAVEQPTGFALVILTLPSLPENTTLEEYAVAVYEKWGIGKKGKDAGALILAAIGDRQVRIEVGYGAEGFLPDAICKRIIEQSMTPAFRKGDFDAGFLTATTEIIQRAATEYRLDLSTLALNKPPPRPISTGQPIKIGPFQLLIILALILLLLGTRPGRSILMLFILSNFLGGRNNSGRGGFGGGFSSRGGFGGFGGGMSGGGGASGRW